MVAAAVNQNPGLRAPGPVSFPASPQQSRVLNIFLWKFTILSLFLKCIDSGAFMQLRNFTYTLID